MATGVIALETSLVKILCSIRNPQITNAHILYKVYKSLILNKWLSMLVGISEAIRLLLAYLYSNFNYIYSNIINIYFRTLLIKINLILNLIAFSTFVMLV